MPKWRTAGPGRAAGVPRSAPGGGNRRHWRVDRHSRTLLGVAAREHQPHAVRARAHPGEGRTGRAAVACDAAARSRSARVPAACRVARRAPARRSGRSAIPTLSRLKNVIAAKRQELTRLEEARQRQLAELQGRLAQLKTVYTAESPECPSVQQNLSACPQEQPQAWRSPPKSKNCRRSIDKRARRRDRPANQGGAGTPLGRGGHAAVNRAAPMVERAPRRSPRGAAAAERPESRVREPAPALRAESARERPGAHRRRPHRARGLAGGVQISLHRDSAGAGSPDPISPNVPMIFAAGLLASLFLALAVVVCKDLLSNRILEDLAGRTAARSAGSRDPEDGVNASRPAARARSRQPGRPWSCSRLLLAFGSVGTVAAASARQRQHRRRHCPACCCHGRGRACGSCRCGFRCWS